MPSAGTGIGAEIGSARGQTEPEARGGAERVSPWLGRTGRTRAPEAARGGKSGPSGPAHGARSPAGIRPARRAAARSRSA